MVAIDEHATEQFRCISAHSTARYDDICQYVSHVIHGSSMYSHLKYFVTGWFNANLCDLRCFYAALSGYDQPEMLHLSIPTET